MMKISRLKLILQELFKLQDELMFEAITYPREGPNRFNDAYMALEETVGILCKMLENHEREMKERRGDYSDD